MDAAKEYLKDRKIMPRISFKKTPKVTISLISDEKRTIQDQTGNDVDGLAIKVMHEDTEKEIFTSSISLIQQLSEIEENETVTIEMKKKKVEGEYRTFYEVTSEKAQAEVKDEEIPPVEDYEGS